MHLKGIGKGVEYWWFLIGVACSVAIGCGKQPLVGTWTSTLNGVPIQREFKSDKTYEVTVSIPHMEQYPVLEHGTWSLSGKNLHTEITAVEVKGPAGPLTAKLKQFAEQTDKHAVDGTIDFQSDGKILVASEGRSYTLTPK